MAERSKALRSGRSLVLQAWVRIPLLTTLLINKGTVSYYSELAGYPASLWFSIRPYAPSP